MRSIGFLFGVAGLVCASSCMVEPEDIYFKPCGADAAMGGRGGSGGEGGSAAEGGGGANQGGMGGDPGPAPECVMDSDCVGVLEAPDPRCGALRCTAEQKCAVEVTEGPIASQRYGDCKKSICDVTGHLVEVGDDSDYFNDGNQCTIDFCQNGPTHFEFPDGSLCPESGEGYCYKGTCVECISSDIGAMCKGQGQVCDSLWCVDMAACMGLCGGNCAPCASGLPCIQGSDCISLSCVNGLCVPPTCTDGVKNDGETGLDCGAPSCASCPAGQGCTAHDDCDSKVCVLGVCQGPSCFDGVQNGDEVGVDCGGVACGGCVAMP